MIMLLLYYKKKEKKRIKAYLFYKYTNNKSPSANAEGLLLFGSPDWMV